MRDIVAEFGDNILGSDATIDRKKLGAIVFSDSNAMSVSLIEMNVLLLGQSAFTKTFFY